MTLNDPGVWYGETGERIKKAKSPVPQIMVNQVWVAKTDGGEILRALRILAKHPDGDVWIYEELPAKFFKGGRAGFMGKTEEFNLRFVFELES